MLQEPAMSPTDLQIQARAFFDAFVEAFSSFSGAAIAERYRAPYLAFHNAGSVQIFQSTQEIAAYFQRVLDDYYARGCRTCRHLDLEVTPLGDAALIGTVTWELLSENQTVLSAWRESYNLCRSGDRLLVYVSTDHPG
jgi:hypothetical protein